MEYLFRSGRMVSDYNLMNRSEAAELLGKTIIDDIYHDLPKIYLGKKIVRFQFASLVKWMKKNGFCERLKQLRLIDDDATEYDEDSIIGKPEKNITLE